MSEGSSINNLIVKNLPRKLVLEFVAAGPAAILTPHKPNHDLSFSIDH